jgi:signal transduction histidine kinase
MTGSQRDRPVASMAAGRRPFDGSPEGQPDRQSIPGHARPRLWDSVRVRLLIPVLMATVAVAVLGTVQVGAALGDAGRADRSSRLAQAVGKIGALAHQISTEYVETNQASRRGTPSTLEEQVGSTDIARADYEEIRPRLREDAPELGRLLDTADRALDGLTSARNLAIHAPDGAAEVAAFYQQIVTALIAVVDALPPQISDSGLIELSRSVALAASLDELAALQFDLVSRALIQGELRPSEQLTLAQWVGGERTQVDALTNLPVGGESYGPVQRSAGSTAASNIRQVLLDDRTGEAVLTVSKAGWASAQTERRDRLWTMEQQLVGRLVHDAVALGTAARERASLFAGGLLVVVVATLGASIAMVVRISRRLRRTRYAALTAARIELPTAIANVTAARDAGTVRAALTDSSARVDAMLHSGPNGMTDEFGELATAFGAVHRQALRLAADQALLRMEVQAMFIALSRRGQTLVQRQIQLIDEFGRNETDPESLDQLFALDHLAARMRRNEENLLVLAGGEPGRWIIRPVAVVDLIRAAAQEIEEYRRVELIDAPDLAIAPVVAGDVIHLLAELLENATSYSPPGATVRVSVLRSPDGLLVNLSDTGIGMPLERLREANNRLAHPSALTSTLVGTMGLLVVARLAQRHGISVALDSHAAAGTTATVLLPDWLLLPLTEEDRLYSGRWLRDLDAADAPTHPASVVPAAAVTSLPPTSPQLPILPTLPSLPQPRAPLPLEARSLETIVPEPQPEPAGYTATGLPRRPPDALPSAVDGSPSLRSTTPMPEPATPDPEAIRARLSSLAGGIAAAQSAAQNVAHDQARNAARDEVHSEADNEADNEAYNEAIEARSPS